MPYIKPDAPYHEPYVIAALTARPWTAEDRAKARELLPNRLHLGEVAEALNRSVLDLQCEFGIGPKHTVQLYRRVRREALRRRT